MAKPVMVKRTYIIRLKFDKEIKKQVTKEKSASAIINDILAEAL